MDSNLPYHRADRVSGDLKEDPPRPFARFETFASQEAAVSVPTLVYERSPNSASVLTEALFRASRTTPHAVRATEGRGTVLGRSLLGLFTAILAVAVGLGFVVAVVLIPAYLVAWPFRWFGAETLAFEVSNGMALFTLFRVDNRDAVAHAGPSQRGEADLRARAPKLRRMQDLVAGDFVKYSMCGISREHARPESPPPERHRPGWYCSRRGNFRLAASGALRTGARSNRCPAQCSQKPIFAPTSSSILLRLRAMSHFSFPTVL